MSRAKKVASERLMQIKALAGIKFPYLSEKVVVVRGFMDETVEYPHYDYKSGRIILFRGESLVPGITAATENRF